MKKYLLTMLLSLSLLFSMTDAGFCLSPENNEPGGRPPTPEQREELRKRIEMIKMWKLTQTLDLDDKTAAELFPLMNRYDREKAEVQHTIRKNMQELKENIESKNERRLSSIMKNLETYHGQLKEIEEREWSDMKNVLTIEQQAKLVLFRMNFRREIRDIIAKTQKRKAGRYSGVRERRSPSHGEPY